MIKILLATCAIIFAAPAMAQTATSGSMSGSTSGVYYAPQSINIPQKSLRTVGTAIGPSLGAAGLDNCAGSVSGGIGLMGIGLSGGTTYTMQPCDLRAMARALDGLGQRAAAIHYLAANDPKLRASLAAAGAITLTDTRGVPVGAQYANTVQREITSTGSVRPVAAAAGKPPFCSNPSTYNASLCN